MKKVRVTLNNSGVHLVHLFPISNQANREIVENASDAEEAFMGQETGDLEGNQLEFVFANDDNSFELTVYEWDEDNWERGEEIMYVDDYELSAWDLDMYMADFELDLKSDKYEAVLYNSLNEGLKAVNEGKVAPADFILEAMRQGLLQASNYYTISDEDEEEKKPHYGVVCAQQFSDNDSFDVSFTIELEDDEEFDPDMLAFINVASDDEKISPVIRDKVSHGTGLLNVALYNGKAFFSCHDDFLVDNCLFEADESEYDIINMDLSKKE